VGAFVLQRKREGCKEDELLSRPLLVIDAGTSVTLEVIDRDGVFRGGIIANGLKLLKNGLTGGGASQLALALPEMGGDHPLPALLGCSSVDCMTSGIVHALLGIVETVKRRADIELGCSTYVIATGGDGNFLQKV
jgi:type III pantothenate kinase